MEEENEVLDWGNEDDEQQHQDSHRKSSAADLDAEDSVSLGEDEDEQDYPTYQQQDTNANDSKSASTPKSTSQNSSLPQQPQSSGELKQEDSSTSQLRSSTGSPSRNQNSTNQKSPQRSHSFTSTRITHALPPKPVATNVPFLHPSHPSIVEATAMSTRTTSRSEFNQNTVNGSFSTTSSTGGGKSSSGPIDPDSAPLPPGWEVRHPRSGSSRDIYYYNIQTQESTWSRPVSSPTSPSSFSESRGSTTRRCRRDSEFSRPSRTQLSDISSDLQKSAITPSAGSKQALSYEDRHYRPAGADLDVTLVENRRDRKHDNMDPRFNQQPQRAFTPPASPPHSRERNRERSPSPVPVAAFPPRGRDIRPRNSRSGRGGRYINTDADSSMQRDGDSHTLAAFNSSRNNWGPAPSDLPSNNSSNQGPRRQQRQQQQNLDPSSFEDRFVPHRNGSTRGRNKDREQSRAVEMRENRNQSMNAPRTRSPQLYLSDREPTYKAQPELEEPPSTSTSTSTPVSAPPMPPIQQRKRDRPSRFDQPIAISPVLPTAMAAAEVQSLNRLKDDIYVPDDILVPLRSGEGPPHEHDELTTSQITNTNANVLSLYSNKYIRADVDRDRGQSSSDHGRSSPTSDTQARSGRKRAPLPPQSERFREMASRPKLPPPPTSDQSTIRQVQHRPPPQLSPLMSAHVLPLGPRDQQQRPTNSNHSVNDGSLPDPHYPSQVQAQKRGDNDESRPSLPVHSNNIERGSGREDREQSGMAYPHPPSEMAMDTDLDNYPPNSYRMRLSPSLRHSTDDVPPLVGSGTYVDREAAVAGDAPRGPRAMASRPSVSTPGGGYGSSHSTSPTTPYGYNLGSGGRVRDHSPPLHGHTHEGRREFDPYVAERSQNRREARGRLNDFPRPIVPLKLSSTNSVPIGSIRKGTGNGVGGPSRYPSGSGPPAGLSTANMEPVRNIRMRVPPPNKESYERPTYEKTSVDNYRPARSDSGGPRPREDSPTLEKRQSTSVNITNTREPSRTRKDLQYPASDSNQNRFRPGSIQDGSRQPAARTWTQREPSPRDLPRTSYGGEGHRALTPPLIPRETLQIPLSWVPRDITQHYDEMTSSHREYRGSHSTSHHEDVFAFERNKFASGPEIRRSGSLEGRLGEKYEERYIEPPRQTHGLPPRGQNNYPLDPHRKSSNRRDSFAEGNVQPEWSDRDTSHRLNENPQVFDNEIRGGLDARPSRISRPVRLRRPQSMDHVPPVEDPMRMTVDPPFLHPPQEQDSRQRPEISRRSGSLLERLSSSLGQSGDSTEDNFSQSLRDRVQIPSKRDREDMVMGDRYPMDVDEGGYDGYDSTNKKARRRIAKARKPRRGGP